MGVGGEGGILFCIQQEDEIKLFGLDMGISSGTWSYGPFILTTVPAAS